MSSLSINSGAISPALVPVTTASTSSPSVAVASPASNSSATTASSTSAIQSQDLSTALNTVLGTLTTMLCTPATTQSTTTSTTATPAASPTPSSSSSSTSTTASTPNIVQIDDFSSGSGHGQKVAGILQQNGNANIQQFDIGGGDGRTQQEPKISQALDQTIQKVKNGEKVDAVNLSYMDTGNDTAQAKAIREKINTLNSLGVPVAVAAGNDGPNAQNQLTTPGTFVVESATNGKRNSTSGLGNVRADGSTTSYATPVVTAKLAQLHAQGYTSDQILQNPNLLNGS